MTRALTLSWMSMPRAGPRRVPTAATAKERSWAATITPLVGVMGVGARAALNWEIVIVTVAMFDSTPDASLA